MNIFTYGSLMFERVWTVVVAGTYRKTNARLFGYQRRKIRGEAYPALVPGTADDWVDGVVYLDVGQRDAVRLDRFEGVLLQQKKRDLLTSGRQPNFDMGLRFQRKICGSCGASNLGPRVV